MDSDDTLLLKAEGSELRHGLRVRAGAYGQGRQMVVGSAVERDRRHRMHPQAPETSAETSPNLRPERRSFRRGQPLPVSAHVAAQAGTQRVEMRQQHDALLLVGIGARNDRGCTACRCRLAGRCGTPAGM